MSKNQTCGGETCGALGLGYAHYEYAHTSVYSLSATDPRSMYESLVVIASTATGCINLRLRCMHIAACRRCASRAMSGSWRRQSRD